MFRLVTLIFPMRSVLLMISVLLSCSAASSYAMNSDDPADWLEMMVGARTKQTYQGTFVFSQGGDISSMRVLHRFADGVEQERLIALDGNPREIFRTGDTVICIFPGNEQVQLEQALPARPFQASLQNIVPIKTVYSIKVAGMERIAGYEVVKVAVMARDQFRYSYLLWLEKKTGLLVKSVLTGQDGKVLESFQFTSLEIGGAIADKEIASGSVGIQITHEAYADKPSREPSPLVHHWLLEWLPQGFGPAQYVSKRNSIMPENSRTQVYSDGLAMFSVFVEPIPAGGMPEGASQMGATTAYSRYIDAGKINYVVTIVGEVPLVTASKIANSLRILPLSG